MRSLSTGVRGQRRPYCRVTVPRSPASVSLSGTVLGRAACLLRGSCFSRCASFASVILRREVSCPPEPCPISWGAVRAGSVTENDRKVLSSREAEALGCLQRRCRKAEVGAGASRVRVPSPGGDGVTGPERAGERFKAQRPHCTGRTLGADAGQGLLGRKLCFARSRLLSWTL